MAGHTIFLMFIVLSTIYNAATAQGMRIMEMETILFFLIVWFSLLLFFCLVVSFVCYHPSLGIHLLHCDLVQSRAFDCCHSFWLFCFCVFCYYFCVGITCSVLRSRLGVSTWVYEWERDCVVRAIGVALAVTKQGHFSVAIKEVSLTSSKGVARK